MSDLLGIGASGVLAYRSALSVVGDNIVNAETAGYARRRAVLAETGVSSSTNAIYRDRVSLGGVGTAEVKRAWDDFRAADSRLATSTAARADTRVRWLGTIESALNDGPTGIGQSIAGVFSTGSTLAADPGNSFNRRAFLGAIDATADAFRTTDAQLGRVADGVAAEAQTMVDATNSDLAALARLNVALRRAGTGTSTHVQLADERDRLLDTLASRIEIEVVQANDGSVRVSLPRSIGLTLVDNEGKQTKALSLAQAADGRITLGTLDGDSTSIMPAQGALAALIDTAHAVADRRGKLGAMATDFATALNGWSEAGVDANGAAGTALLAFDPDRPAATLAPAIANRDPATVAAALSATTSVDNGDGTTTDTTTVVANGNLLDLPNLRGPNDTERRWATMVANQAQSLASAKSEEATTSARRDAALAARDDVSGVDLDREAAELLRFQQAYNGSAKIIQVARETLQTVMDILR